MENAENLKESPEYRYDPGLAHTHDYLDAKNLDPEEEDEDAPEVNLEPNKYFAG